MRNHIKDNSGIEDIMMIIGMVIIGERPGQNSVGGSGSLWRTKCI